MNSTPRAFTLIELVIAIGIGTVIAYAAFATVRAAAQATTTANRLSLENGMIRAGYAAAVEECDFWRSYDDPDNAVGGQGLRAFDAGRGRGLPFTPLRLTRFLPAPAQGTPPDPETARGWDAAYQWPMADSRTWFHGNLVECVDTTQRVFGHHELFAHLDRTVSLNKLFRGGVPFGAAEPRHTWWFNQLEGVKNALGYYGAVDYCPANALYGVLGDAGDDLLRGTADDDAQSLSREWCRPEGDGGGVQWRFANSDGGTRWPRGIYRPTRDSSYAVVPASPGTGARTDTWPVSQLVEQHSISWPTSRTSSVTWGVPDLLNKTRIVQPLLTLAPAYWPAAQVTTVRFLTYSRFAAVFSVGWTSPVTGEHVALNFSALGSSLRGARQQRHRDGGWSRPGDPTLDSY